MKNYIQSLAFTSASFTELLAGLSDPTGGPPDLLTLGRVLDRVAGWLHRAGGGLPAGAQSHLVAGRRPTQCARSQGAQ